MTNKPTVPPQANHGLRRFVRLSLVMVVSLALALVVLEIAVRMIPLYPTRFIIPDAQLGWRFQPDAQGVWFNVNCPREFMNPVQINRRGMHDIDHALAKPEGVRRVLILGDSLVAGLEIPLAGTFFRQLETYLNAPESPLRAIFGDSERIEVMTGAVSGYSTVQEWLYFSAEGQQVDADVVVLMFTPHNDFLDNAPRYIDTTAEWTVTRPYYEVAADGTGVIVPPQAVPLPPLHRLLLESSALYKLLVLRLRTLFPAPPSLSADDLAQQRDAGWALTFNVVGELRDEVESTGAEFGVLIDQSQISSQEERATIHEIIGQAFDEDGITYLSLLSDFDALAAAGTQVRFGCDTHWTPAGHDLGARIITPFVERLLIAANSETINESP